MVLKRKIRALSQEREFISYDEGMAVRRSTPVQRKTTVPHRRTVSTIEKTAGKDRKSPESHFRTNDTSFSSSTTPKRLGKVNVPSLKEGMDRLLQGNQRYNEAW